MSKRNEIPGVNGCGAERMAEVCMVGPSAARRQMAAIVEQCNMTDRILATDGRIVGNAALANRAGFVAEELHAESFNLDAILKDRDVRAFTDRYADTPLTGNNPVNDIVITEKGRQVQGAQVKYYRDGKRTADALREYGRDGRPHYEETDAMICPSDQLEDVKTVARKTEVRNHEGRPHVSEAAREVRSKVSDRLEHDGVESRPVSKREAEQIAKGGEKGRSVHRKIQDDAKTASTVQRTAKAAASAAVVSAVIAGTINVVDCLNKVKNGEMASGAAVRAILKDTAIAAGDSALKAAGATAAVSVATRSLPELFAGRALQANLATGAVGGAAVCAIDLVECLVAVAAGQMTWSQLEERTGKIVVQTGSGVIGASIGGAIGSVAGPVGAMAGALIGGMITSVAATISIDNHIEKPFRETLENTRSLVEAEELMSQAIAYLGRIESTMADFRKEVFISAFEFERADSVRCRQIEVNWQLINNIK